MEDIKETRLKKLFGEFHWEFHLWYRNGTLQQRASVQENSTNSRRSSICHISHFLEIFCMTVFSSEGVVFLSLSLNPVK